MIYVHEINQRKYKWDHSRSVDIDEVRWSKKKNKKQPMLNKINKEKSTKQEVHNKNMKFLKQIRIT